MDRRPVFILNKIHVCLHMSIRNWNHLSLGDGIYRMATNSTDLSSLCNNQHVIGPQELDEA